MTIENIITDIVVKKLAPLREAIERIETRLTAVEGTVRQKVDAEAVDARFQGIWNDVLRLVEEKTRTEEVSRLVTRLQENLNQVQKLTEERFVQKETFVEATRELKKLLNYNIDAVLLTDSRVVDHSHIEIVPVEGLKGGGPISRNVPLSLDLESLESNRPRPTSKFVFSEALEGGAFSITFDELVKAMKRYE